MTILEKIQTLTSYVGNTPLHKLKNQHLNVYAKLEYNNFFGSTKDRAAFNIIKQAIQSSKINYDTVVIASSSGNFAIATASICKLLNIPFIPVIDPNINPEYERYLRMISSDVIKVSSPDSTGGFLLTRIAAVRRFCEENSSAYYADQYNDPNNYLGYYHTLGPEICNSFDRLDYVFIAVSSGGTIIGISKKVKEKFPHAKIVAVDVEGSVIFKNEPQKRYISGIGASMPPPNLHEAFIDDIVYVSQLDVAAGCKALLNEQLIFAGASSGAVYHAIGQYFAERGADKNANALFICTDKGYAYMDTVYNPRWVQELEIKLELTKMAVS